MSRIELTNQHPRMTREARTIDAMVSIYCHDMHGTRGDDLCDECTKLAKYAGMRLEKCPYQEHKTTCTKCPTHCYKLDMREGVRKVMRYAGPRMIWKYPYLAIMHVLVDSRRNEPLRTGKRVTS